MPLLGLLKKTAQGNTFILVGIDRVARTTRCILLRNATAATVAAAFLEYCVYVYGASHYSLSDNKKQFIPRLFDFVCAILGSKHYLITVCSPQSNGQAEQLIRTTVQRLRYYVADHETDWDQ